MTEKSFLERIGSLDVKVIYVMQALLILVPMIFPLNIPIQIGDTTNEFYDLIESYPSGSIIMVGASGISPSYYPALAPALKAFMEHALSNDLRLIAWTGSAVVPPMWEKLMSQVSAKSGKTYGEDWVFLGYIPGGEPAVAGLANDLWKTALTDSYGTPLDQLPLMANVHNAEDIAAYYEVTGGTDTLENVLRQFNTPFGTPILLCTSTGMIPATMPYYPDQVVAVLYGIRGGAEYEILVEKPWRGVSTTDVTSVLNLYVICVIILGNLSLLAKKEGNEVK